MVYSFLASWISFVFPVFYKRLQIRNAHWLRAPGPAIIAINHPNAFADPVGLGFIMYPTRFWYLARGDVFKPGFMNWILAAIGIIPIYRLRDEGKEGLAKNDETYRRVNEFLKNDLKVIVFAEGLCIMERRLRPLKKGVARMVFGALDSIDGKDLKVIPVGVNYSQPDKFRSNLYYNVGEPISVHEFLKGREDSPVKNQKAFLELLEPKLRSLITHINDPKNDDLVLQVEELFKKEILLSRGLDPKKLHEDFEVIQDITQAVNRVSVKNPNLLESFRSSCQSYFDELKKYKVKDWLIRPDFNKKLNYLHFLSRCFLLLLTFPLFAAGYILNAIPHFLSFYITGKIVRHREFFASFMIVVASVLFLIFYSLLFFMVWHLSGTPGWSLLFVVSAMLSGRFCLTYFPFARKTIGMFRVLTKPTLYSQLAETRRGLRELFNKF